MVSVSRTVVSELIVVKFREMCHVCAFQLKSVWQNSRQEKFLVTSYTDKVQYTSFKLAGADLDYVTDGLWRTKILPIAVKSFRNRESSAFDLNLTYQKIILESE